MTKNKQVLIRLTNDDKELAKHVSSEILGKENISKLFVKMLHSTAKNQPILTDVQLATFRLAVCQLSGIARNLNQVTRRLNSEEVVSLDNLGSHYLESLKDYIYKLNNEFKKIINNK